jgi:hypothetical protein
VTDSALTRARGGSSGRCSPRWPAPASRRGELRQAGRRTDAGVVTLGAGHLGEHRPDDPPRALVRAESVTDGEEQRRGTCTFALGEDLVQLCDSRQSHPTPPIERSYNKDVGAPVAKHGEGPFRVSPCFRPRDVGVGELLDDLPTLDSAASPCLFALALDRGGGVGLRAQAEIGHCAHGDTISQCR